MQKYLTRRDSAEPRKIILETKKLGYKEFNPENLLNAINLLVYGSQIQYFDYEKNEVASGILYMCDEDPQFLRLIEINDQNMTNSARFIDLAAIKRISTKPGGFQFTNSPVNKKTGIRLEIFLSIVDKSNHDFTILFQGNNEGIEKRNLYWQGLQYFIAEMYMPNMQSRLYDLAKKLWIESDKDGNKQLDFEEIYTLLQNLHIGVSKEYFQKMFEQFDENKNGKLEFEEFNNLLSWLMKKNELKEIFAKYSTDYQIIPELTEFDVHHLDGIGIMTMEELNNFNETENKSKEEVKYESICPLLKQSKGLTHGYNRNTLSFYEFSSIIFSVHNSIANPEKMTQYQDMTHPLNDYYINSSHNTYLLNDQLVGQTSPEAYIRVLETGCRVLELDCWDGENGIPIVTHGYTVTTVISFSDAINTIKEYAFRHSRFPVLLTLEMHCCKDQQIKIMKTLRLVLGQQLYLINKNAESLNALPSPMELLGKVVVRSANRDHWQGFVGLEHDTIWDDIFPEENHDPEMKLHHQLTESLRMLPIFNIWDISSMNEDNLLTLAAKNVASVLDFSCKALLRVYPRGTRFMSSNYEPTKHWAHGAQIVALNHQTKDDGMLLNMAKFMENSCGYVLKPEYLRSKCPPEKLLPPSAFTKPIKKLTVELISGQQLTKGRSAAIEQPYVQFSIAGLPLDEKRSRSTTYLGSGFHPQWSHQKFEFNLCGPDFAFLKVEVFETYTMSDARVSWFAIPFTCIREGLRVIPLWDMNFTEIPNSYLLVRVAIQDI